MTLMTKTWHLADWDRVIVEALERWQGDRIFRPTLRNAIFSQVSDPKAHQAEWHNGRDGVRRPRGTLLSRRLVNMLIVLDRAGIIDRDDSYIWIKDRSGLSVLLDVGHITYSWEKEDHDL